MMVADGMVPIWHQDIGSHRDDLAHLAYIRNVHGNAYSTREGWVTATAILTLRN